MEQKHQTVIESNGINRTQIIIDGVDLLNTIATIKFTYKIKEAPVIEIEPKNCNVSIQSPKVSRLPEILTDYYEPIL